MTPDSSQALLVNAKDERERLIAAVQHGYESLGDPGCFVARDALRVFAIFERELKIAKLKNRGSLVHNLCQDCRDKQKGKPCLACTVQALERKNAELQSANAALRDVLAELYATVRGECPSLLNEDSGGNAGLDQRIVEAMGRYKE